MSYLLQARQSVCCDAGQREDGIVLTHKKMPRVCGQIIAFLVDVEVESWEPCRELYIDPISSLVNLVIGEILQCSHYRRVYKVGRTWEKDGGQHTSKAQGTTHGRAGGNNNRYREERVDGTGNRRQTDGIIMSTER